ncbi:Opacity-associated protein A N-terminal motif [Raoultella planticola]|uniref:Opacity-associated protein A N-terminal motif n=1 Tax=Raoultella planticola TaxID=575 RepID=A0A485ANF9_RAOPL|nr:Opacity-associated protein A N-terminal motif [Raoultella planticola]
MPGRFDITPTLAKIWHAPDHIRIMDPLPPMHRRGIIAGALLVIIGILLPSEESSSPVQSGPRSQYRPAIAVPAAIFPTGHAAAADYHHADGE